ncbi:hypothetical protein BDF22DRAFT_744090 [Syncephalis plumigaleata]|nr:hypothetical protein BDF22DRAFT_744090 [Syncephalis plumigaleata]
MTTFIPVLLTPALLLIGCMLAPFLLILSFTCLFALLFIYALVLKHQSRTAAYSFQQWSREHPSHHHHHPSNNSTNSPMSLLDQLRSHWAYQLIARSKSVVLTGLQIASGLGALWQAGGLSRIRDRRASVVTNPHLITNNSNNSSNSSNSAYSHSSHPINNRIDTNITEYNRKGQNSNSNNTSNSNNISETTSHTTSNTNHTNNSSSSSNRHHYRLDNKLDTALSIRKYHSRHTTTTTTTTTSLMGVAFVRRPTTSMLDDTRILPTKILPASSSRLKSGRDDIHRLPFMMPSKITAKRQYTTHSC